MVEGRSAPDAYGGLSFALPAYAQFEQMAFEVEKACAQAASLGLTEEETREVRGHVRDIPEILTSQMSEQIRFRCLQRALGEEWRFPLA